MEFLGFTIDVASLTESAIGFAVKISLALIIFVVGRWLAKKAVSFADKMMQRSRLDATVSSFVSKIIYGVLLVIVALAALGQVGVETTSVVAILGGAAVAIGLALSNQLSNFAAGVMIIVFRPFVKGDVIEAAGYVGTVHDISLINTHLTTLNNHDIVIPNSEISTSSLINYTSLPNRRVDVTVGIGYGANIKTAKEVMLAVGQKHPLSFSDPAPVVVVTNLGDSAVELTLNVWTDNADWWALQCDLMEQLKIELDNHNIEIPFPQRSIHVEGLEKLINKS